MVFFIEMTKISRKGNCPIRPNIEAEADHQWKMENKLVVSLKELIQAFFRYELTKLGS